jgi:hypothetical protein
MTQYPSQPAATSDDSRIAGGLIVLVTAIILVGFAKNFYLRAWLGTRPLIVTAWIHGIVMTAWLALFVFQATMVSRGRVDLHRKFGEWSIWLAIAVVAVGIATILVRTRLAFPDATPLMSATVFVAFDGLSLLLFGAFVALAWRYRHRTAIHRRLMVMAVVALLPPAFGRLVAYLRHDQIEIIVVGLMLVTTLTFVTVDTFRSHRLQRASWVPGLLILLVNTATYFAQVSI